MFSLPMKSPLPITLPPDHQELQSTCLPVNAILRRKQDAAKSQSERARGSARGPFCCQAPALARERLSEQPASSIWKFRRMRLLPETQAEFICLTTGSK